MRNNMTITADCVESAYCFIHQKLRVYEFSTNPTQRDDIEYAISQYVEEMNPQLYRLLSEGRGEFLLDHTKFEEDMREAQGRLEVLMETKMSPRRYGFHNDEETSCLCVSQHIP